MIAVDQRCRAPRHGRGAVAVQDRQLDRPLDERLGRVDVDVLLDAAIERTDGGIHRPVGHPLGIAPMGDTTAGASGGMRGSASRPIGTG